MSLQSIISTLSVNQVWKKFLEAEQRREVALWIVKAFRIPVIYRQEQSFSLHIEGAWGS